MFSTDLGPLVPEVGGGGTLEGFYDDWALRERERLRMLYLDCLGSLLRRHSATGALEPALRSGRQILVLDPLREDIHREVIRLHVRNGIARSHSGWGVPCPNARKRASHDLCCR